MGFYMFCMEKNAKKTLPPSNFGSFFCAFWRRFDHYQNRTAKKKKTRWSTTRMTEISGRGGQRGGQRHKTSQKSSRDHFFFMLLQPFLSLLFSLSSFSPGSGMNSLWTRMSLMWIYRTKKQTRRSNECLKIEWMLSLQGLPTLSIKQIKKLLLRMQWPTLNTFLVSFHT